jgi:signal transduction histidine kinase
MSTSRTSPGKPENAAAGAAVESVRELADRSAAETKPEITLSASLLEICRAMGAGVQLKEVLNTTLKMTMREMRAQEGSILLFDQHQDRLQMLASFGLPPEITAKGYIPRKGSIAEWVIEHKEPLVLNDRATGSEYTALDETRRRIYSSMCIPLIARGGVLGTINLNRTDPAMGPFGNDDLGLMAVLASQAAIYIENSRLHESLLRSERLAAIGQTVAGISHCMKNILTGMKGGVSLIRMARQGEDWETLDQGVEILGHSVNRVSSLALDMLNYSKERVPRREDVDLDEMMKEIRGVTRDKAARLGCEVVVNIAEDARTVRADSQELFRALLNIVENGLDATGEGNKVFITSECSQSEPSLRRLSESAEAAIVIRISDEGPGISEENAAQIFDPFFSTKGSKGTGLGLAVTQKILREHGGTIEIASKPGQPAVFAIYLPA